MKKLLSLIGVLSFTTPVALVTTACNTTNTNTISPRDIINLATSKMQDHIFLMEEDLGLQKLPETNAKYDDLLDRAKNNIISYYKNLVTNGANEWEYSTVKVEIDGKKSNFITKYGDGVESKVKLKINLYYGELVSHAEVTVKISNNLTSLQEKATQVAKYLNGQLNSIELSFKTLLPDNFKSNDSSNGERIQTALKSNLTTAKKDQEPILDVEDIDIVVQTPKDKVFYQLDSNTVDNSNKITGKLENLIIQVGYQNGSFYSSLDVTSLKVSQKITDTKTQIETIIYTTQVNEFNKADLNNSELPKEGMTLAEYDEDSAFRKKVQAEIFKSINEIYPTAKINSSNTWNQDRFQILNPEGSVFIKDSNSTNPGEGFGHFMISVKFTIKDNIQSINNNFKIRLTDR